MAEQHFQVEVEGDHLKKLANAKPVHALAEMIWNACDADASRVDVHLERNALGQIAVTVSDNGEGFPHDKAQKLFAKLGGSWKAGGVRSPKGRMLHGKEGRGRFKALAIGRVADWYVRYRQDGTLYSFSITLLRENIIDVRVTEPVPVDEHLGTGVELRISELDRDYRVLEPELAVPELSTIFALYLTDYRDVKIFYEYQEVDPLSAIATKDRFDLSPVNVEG